MLQSLTAIGLFWYILWRSTPNSEQNAIQNQIEDGDEVQVVKVPLEDLIGLKQLFTEHQYQHLLERVLEFSDPVTVLRIARLSRYHNSILTSSSILQLKLRRHYHRLPSQLRRAPYHAAIDRRIPASKRLAALISLQEKVSTMDPSVQQRLMTSYVDVLCSGDYIVITRALRGKSRIEGAPNMGWIEDGWSVMVRNGDLPKSFSDDNESPKSSTTSNEDQDVSQHMTERIDEWVVDGDDTTRSLPSSFQSSRISSGELEGWEQWTVETNEDIADMTVRADDDLVVVAYNVRLPGDSETNDVVQLHFYHLETFQPLPHSPRRGSPIRHSEAALPVIQFRHSLRNPYKVRLRAGPKGRVLLWISEEDNTLKGYTMTWDWRRGVELGCVWTPRMVGIPHDFGFISADTVLAAVQQLTQSDPVSSASSCRQYTHQPNLRPTQMTLQFYRVHDGNVPAQTPESNPADWSFSNVKSCSSLSTFCFPKFTYRYVHSGKFPPDEVQPSEPQSFRLNHCSVAAKPAPMPFASGSTAGSSTGILVVTLEGDFGPIHHPNQIPHDHIQLAFATISIPRLVGLMRQRRAFTFDEWSSAVSWDFGPMNWMTGYGNRTVQVSRWVTSPLPVGEDDDDDANMDLDTGLPERGLTMLNVNMKDYNPAAIAQKGRTYTGILGAGKGAPDPNAEDPYPTTGFPPLFNAMSPNAMDQDNPFLAAWQMGQLGVLPTATPNGNGNGNGNGDAAGGQDANLIAHTVQFSANITVNGTADNVNPNPNPNHNQNHNGPTLTAAQVFNALINQQPLDGSNLTNTGPGNPTPNGTDNVEDGGQTGPPFGIETPFDSLFSPPSMNSRSISARVVTHKSHGKVYEMFGDTEIVNRLPYLEVNVNIPVEGERDGEALENPFKTILSGDKLVVCDDAGFDILSF